MKNLLRNTWLITAAIALVFGVVGHFLGNKGGYKEGFRKGKEFGYDSCDSKFSNPFAENLDCPYDTGMVSLVHSDIAKQRISNYGYWIGEQYGRAQMGRAKKENIDSKSKENEDYVKLQMHYLTGWTIPIDEIVNEVQKNSSIHFFRAYLSMENISSSDSSNMRNTHLILTPIDNMGKECKGKDMKLPKYHNLVRPCPQMCDESSELYQAYQDGFNKGFLGIPDSVYHHNP